MRSQTGSRKQRKQACLVNWIKADEEVEVTRDDTDDDVGGGGGDDEDHQTSHYWARI
jgi:hypothetical protein